MTDRHISVTGKPATAQPLVDSVTPSYQGRCRTVNCYLHVIHSRKASLSFRLRITPRRWMSLSFRWRLAVVIRRIGGEIGTGQRILMSQTAMARQSAFCGLIRRGSMGNRIDPFSTVGKGAPIAASASIDVDTVLLARWRAGHCRCELRFDSARLKLLRDGGRPPVLVTLAAEPNASADAYRHSISKTMKRVEIEHRPIDLPHGCTTGIWNRALDGAQRRSRGHWRAGAHATAGANGQGHRFGTARSVERCGWRDGCQRRASAPGAPVPCAEYAEWRCRACSITTVSRSTAHVWW